MERNQTFDGKECNLYLEEGTLKIKKKQIKAGKETTIPMDKWRNMVAWAKDDILEELDMGDGKDDPITKYVAGQYASYYSYWLNYSDLNKFYTVFQKWDPTLWYNTWKSNLHNLIPINEAE